MTSFHGIKAIVTIGAVLSMTAGLALAAESNVSSDQILQALKPKAVTRGLSTGPKVDPAVKAREIGFVATLRNRKTRSLSLNEREQIAEIASTKPKIDLDIQFDYNSADIRTSSLPDAQSLGQALSNPSLKGSTFIVAGHTDAVGGEAFNQGLSERRADTIKKYLVDKFGIAGTDLLGHIDAALGHLEGHVEPLGLEVAALLGDHEGTEGRERDRRRQEIGDVLGRGRRHAASRHRSSRADPHKNASQHAKPPLHAAACSICSRFIS